MSAPGLHVLVVEDDDSVAQEVVEALAQAGCVVDRARDGREALELVNRRSHRPAVILLDLMMPEMDGIEFLEQQNEIPLLHGVPIVVLTAFGQLARSLPETVRAVLHKPVRLETLVRAIQTAASHG